MKGSNHTSALGAAFAIFVVAGTVAHSAGGQGTALVRLQGSTPGTVQTGHVNLSGAGLFGKVVADNPGAGLHGSLAAENNASVYGAATGNAFAGRFSGAVEVTNGYLYTGSARDAIFGETTGANHTAVLGLTAIDSSSGVSGLNQLTGAYGILGYKDVAGVYGTNFGASNIWAGRFEGSVSVTAADTDQGPGALTAETAKADANGLTGIANNGLNASGVYGQSAHGVGVAANSSDGYAFSGVTAGPLAARLISSSQSGTGLVLSNTSTLGSDWTVSSAGYTSLDGAGSLVFSSSRAGSPKMRFSALGYVELTGQGDSAFYVRGAPVITNSCYAFTGVPSLATTQANYINQPDFNTLGFTTGGVERVRITNNGVGFGTPNPQAGIHVDEGATNTTAFRASSSGAGWGSGMRFTNTTSGTGREYGIYSGSEGSWHFADATASNDRMVILPNSRIGMGVVNPASALHVNGTITGSAKNFLIDNPRDPANSYLRHACIESSEMLNLYSGTVKTDAKGYATVKVPEWFTALNDDVRYQVTVVEDEDSEGFTLAKVARRLHDGAFVIRTSEPSTTVCWQLTGTRKDAYARAHPLVVEEKKPSNEQGFYLNPVEHGQPKELGLDHAPKR